MIAQNFERIHRSNLVGMGVLPLEFMPGQSWQTLGLIGDENVSIAGIADGLKPRSVMAVNIMKANGSITSVEALCRIDTLEEIDYFKNGGILQYVLRNLAKAG